MAIKPHLVTVRKNVTLSPASEKRIERIRDYTNCSTDADAIRQAIDVFDELMTKQLAGYDVVLEPREPSVGTRAMEFRKLFDAYAVQIAQSNKTASAG